MIQPPSKIGASLAATKLGVKITVAKAVLRYSKKTGACAPAIETLLAVQTVPHDHVGMRGRNLECKRSVDWHAIRKEEIRCTGEYWFLYSNSHFANQHLLNN
jgi:hypothetical protein